jgi:hypothetical protein
VSPALGFDPRYTCTCREILAKDATRHFRGCALRDVYPDHPAAKPASPDGDGGTIILGGVPVTEDRPGTLYFQSGSGRPESAFGDIVFRVDQRDMLRLTGDLRIEVYGVSTAAPAEVVAALREWFAGVTEQAPRRDS